MLAPSVANYLRTGARNTQYTGRTSTIPSLCSTSGRIVISFCFLSCSGEKPMRSFRQAHGEAERSRARAMQASLKSGTRGGKKDTSWERLAGLAGQPSHINMVHANQSAVLLSHVNEPATIRTSQPNMLSTRSFGRCGTRSRSLVLDSSLLALVQESVAR